MEVIIRHTNIVTNPLRPTSLDIDYQQQQQQLYSQNEIIIFI